MRQFLLRPATAEPLADQVRRFCEDFERSGRMEDWQVRQAEQGLRIYFVSFLARTDWHRQPSSAIVDERGGKGDKDRTTLLAERGRDLGWFWVFLSRTLSTDPRAAAQFELVHAAGEGVRRHDPQGADREDVYVG